MQFVDELPGVNSIKPKTSYPKTMDSPKAQRADNYECSVCEKQVPQALIFSKKVSYSTMGVNKRVFKTMTAAWLCLDCLNEDEHFNPKPAEPE